MNILQSQPDFEQLIKLKSYNKIIEIIYIINNNNYNYNNNNNNNNNITINKNNNNNNYNLMNRLFKTGLSPLYLAVVLKDEYLINLFLQNGAMVNMVNYKGDTPLNYIMSMYNDNDINLRNIFIMFLEAGADVNHKDSYNLRPLESAIRYHKLIFLKLLLQYNANFNFHTKCGDTILHLANLYDDDDILRILLINHINPEMKNQQHKTALQIAFEFRKLSKIKILLEYNANFNYTESYVRLFIYDLLKSNDRKTITFLIYHIIKRIQDNRDADADANDYSYNDNVNADEIKNNYNLNLSFDKLLNMQDYRKFIRPYIFELKKMQQTHICINLNSIQSISFYEFLTMDFSTTEFQLTLELIYHKFYEHKQSIYHLFPLFAEILFIKFEWLKNKGIYYEFIYRHLLINYDIENLIQLPINIFRKIISLVNNDEICNI